VLLRCRSPQELVSQGDVDFLSGGLVCAGLRTGGRVEL